MMTESQLQTESKLPVSTLPPELSSSCSSDVFQNEDILELILSFFDPDAFLGDGIWDMDSSTRKVLFSVCLTAKSFVTPALSLLWRLMTSLIPLFKILPTFTKVSDVYTINGAIQSSHLDRLATYSCKIRYLNLQSFQDTICGHFISRLLIEKNFILFPALKTLYIPYLTLPGFQSRGIDNLNQLFLIHGLSLTTLSLGGINSSTEVFTASLLSVLSQRAIATQDLMLSGRLSLDILSFIPRFSRLEGLNITFDAGSVIPSAFIRHCGDLSELTHLIINLNNATIENSNLLPSVQGFEHTLELRLRGDPNQTSNILRSIHRAPSMKTVILGCNSLPADYSPVLSSIESCIRDVARIAPALRSFETNMGSGRAIALPEGVLRPLIQCRDIRSLEIFGVLLPITDDHIEELCAGDNWRNLHTLQLPPSVDGKSPSLISLKILTHNCPMLVKLAFPVDFRLRTPPTLEEERLRAPRGSNTIERLSIHKITTTRYDNEAHTVPMGIAVARFMEYCLPCLKEVRLFGDVLTPDSESWWRTVKTMITEFRAIRLETIVSLS